MPETTLNQNSFSASFRFDEEKDEENFLHDSVPTGTSTICKRALYGKRSTKEISMDLTDLLQDLEKEDSSSSNGNENNRNSNDGSIGIFLEDRSDREKTRDDTGDAFFDNDVSSTLDLGQLSFSASFAARRKQQQAQPQERKRSVRFRVFETIIPSDSLSHPSSED